MPIDVIDIVISGLQTGVDQGALYGASDAGVATGGFAPKGFRTETGNRHDLGRQFGLVELSYDSYVIRTRQNVEYADGTVIIAANPASKGTVVTRGAAIDAEKPFFQIGPIELKVSEIPHFVPDLCEWADENGVKIVNFAGNRESVAPGIQLWTRRLVRIWLDHYRRTSD